MILTATDIRNYIQTQARAGESEEDTLARLINDASVMAECKRIAKKHKCSVLDAFIALGSLL